ncbi:hypothetical protein N802_10725 [Knoellia sinensis KCTC 19936]|uniref:Fibronectin type-III domain-containing protein n=1 Tax=Knoellia sinensis KCTC 19936 TaxID=1385520 RepID=A0A0A0J7Z4_9MICO|nr:VCBS repeat-containing protein [Knoellia sinensis]KGN32172.1 hypothetical protein N802_10725 [Knoellia sinensis KCTC 19936]
MRASLRRLLSILGTAALVPMLLAAAPASAVVSDTAYPTLRGVTMSATTVAAGSSIVAVLDASDDVAIASAKLRFVSSESSHRIETTRPWRDDGRVGLAVPESSTTGAYTLDLVTLTDSSGNSATYQVLGRNLTLQPPVSTGPFTHGLDLSATTFTVTGGVDRTAPRVTSLSMPVRPTYAEAPGVLEVAVDDLGPVEVTAVWRQPYGIWGTPYGKVTARGGTGRVPFRLPIAGTHTLDGLVVIDAEGNGRQYDRDGRESSMNGQARHTLDFSPFDVTLRPSPPSARLIARPGSARVVLHATEDVAKSIDGWRISVYPGSTVRHVPAKAGLTQVDIGGLSNGQSYSVFVTAQSKTGASRRSGGVVRPMLSTNVFAVADATGDRRVDLIARQPFSAAGEGDSYVYPTNGTAGVGRRFAAFRAGDNSCERIAPFDHYILGDGEVLCYGPDLLALNKDGSGSILATGGWSAMRFVDGGSDLTGDGWPDIIGVGTDGALRVYQTRDESRIVSTTKVGGGWGAFTALMQVGDFNGDRKSDLVAVDTAGRVWLYPGNGRAGFGARTQIASGWGGFGAVLPLRDFNGDGKVDIGTITMDGILYMYPGNGRGGFLPRVAIGGGWGVYL